MGLGRILPRSRTARTFLILLAFPLLAYLLLLGFHLYSAWRVARTLDALEALRVGQPVAGFLSAVGSCHIEHQENRYTCAFSAVPLAFDWLQNLLWKLPYRNAALASRLLMSAGLRPLYLRVSCDAEDERILAVSTRVFVAGRYETLEAFWSIGQDIPSSYQEMKLSDEDRRTYMGWYHITSFPSGGEGFKILATPASTEEELRARRINRGCLLSFRGCDGLCELLPEAIPVLTERKRSWGGCTDVPRSHCEPKNDECKNILAE